MIVTLGVKSSDLTLVEEEKIINSLKTIVKDYHVSKFTTSVKVREILQVLPDSLSEDLSKKLAEQLVSYIGGVLENFDPDEFLRPLKEDKGKDMIDQSSLFDIHLEIFVLISQNFPSQFFNELAQLKACLPVSLFYLSVLARQFVDPEILLKEFTPARFNSREKSIQLYRFCRLSLGYLKSINESISESKFVEFLMEWMKTESEYLHYSNIEANLGHLALVFRRKYNWAFGPHEQSRVFLK
jgi:hypothetical protein